MTHFEINGVHIRFIGPRYSMGAIGEPQREIEFEPIEEPVEVPEPVQVPVPEEVPA